MDLAAVAVVAAGYLVGSIDFGVIVPRLLGVDIYSAGSGNPGASNVLRSLGKGVAAVVVAGDVAKGLGATALGALAVSDAAGFAAGAAAVIGHCFPVWHRLRGGKGVAAAGGMTLWLEPILGLAMIVVWALLVGITRRASIASLAVVIGYVPALAVLGRRSWELVWAGAAAALILGRHHANIRRLLSSPPSTPFPPSPTRPWTVLPSVRQTLPTRRPFSR